MGNGRTGGLTRRELVTLGTTAATALLLAGGTSLAWAAADAASAAAGQSQGSGLKGVGGSESGVAKAAGSQKESSDAGSKSDGSSSSNSESADSKASDSKKEVGGSDAASAEGNKARKFKEIPADALISVDDLYELFSDGALKDRSVYVIDIRSHRDYQNQLIEGSRNIPAGRQFDIRMDEIPQDKQVVLVALKNSNRLAECWFTLIANDYDDDLVKVLDGGVRGWVDAGHPTLEDQFLGC